MAQQQQQQQEPPQQIKLSNVAHYYEVMQRNGYYLPKLKSGIVTFDYLNEVRNKVFFCPKYEQLKLRACPRPPAKELLVEYVLHECGRRNLVPGFNKDDKKAKPNKEWLVAVLSTLNTDHPIFGREYLPPHKETKAEKRLR